MTARSIKPGPWLPLAALWLTACSAIQPNPDERWVGYDCERGEFVSVRYTQAGERAVLLRHGQAIELHQQPSGSGFVYSNGPNTIRGKGDELRVEIGRMVPMLCTARGAPR